MPIAVEEQVVTIFAGTNGYVDAVAVADVTRYVSEMLAFMHARHTDILEAIATQKAIDDALKAALKAALGQFATQFK